MISPLGRFSLAGALALALYRVMISIAGARRSKPWQPFGLERSSRSTIQAG